MSIKLKDTIYDLIDKAIKDSSGNTITDTYLNKTKSGTISGDLTVNNLIVNTGANYSGLYKNSVITSGGESDTLWLYTDKKLILHGNEIEFYITPKVRGGYTILHSNNYTDYAATKGHGHTGYASTVKVGSTSYNVSNNVVSLPAYPTIPTSLKNPNSLTITLNGASTAYDGSSAKSVTIDTTKANRLVSPYYYNETTITPDTTAETLFGESASSSYSFSAFMSSHPTWNGYADVWNFTGYCKWGATQLATQYNADDPRVAIRKFNQSKSGWGNWTEFITSANISSQSVNYSTSAGKLSTSRKIWGQYFNGEGNIASTSDLYVNVIKDADGVWLLGKSNKIISIGSAIDKTIPIELMGSLKTKDFTSGTDGTGNVYFEGTGSGSLRIQYHKTSTTWDQLKLQNGVLTFNDNIVYHSGNFSINGNYLPLSGGTLDSSSSCPLYINTTHSIQSCLLLQHNGSNKGQFGYVKNSGIFIYSYETKKHLGIDTDGNPFWGPDSTGYRLLWHTGNLNTIWGQTPNSSGVITGSMSGVTDINWANGGYIWNNTKGTHINPSGGSEGIFDIDMSNNVGIGTNSPTSKLDVRGGISTNIGLTIKDIGGSGVLHTKGSNRVFAIGSGSNSNTQGTEYGILQLYHNGSEFIRLYANSIDEPSWINTGNLGIGTDSPTQKLDVRGNMNVSSVIYFNNSSYVGKGSSATNDLSLYTNTVLRMYASYNTYPSYIYFSGISGSQLLHFAGQPQTEFRNQNNQSQIHLCNSYAIFGYHNPIAGLPTYIDGKDIYMRYGSNHAHTATFKNNGYFDTPGLMINGEAITFTT